MNETAPRPVPIAEQVEYVSTLLRDHVADLWDPATGAISRQRLEVGARTLSAVVSTLQRVAASADDLKCMAPITDLFGRTPDALSAHARMAPGRVMRDPEMAAVEPMTADDARRAMTREAVRQWRERKRAEARARGVPLGVAIGRKSRSRRAAA